MKKFDRGYIYSSLVSDFFATVIIFFAFFGDFFFEEESAARENVIAAIPYLVIAFLALYFAFITYRILYYKTSGYELTETEIKCKRGVLFRKQSVLEYTRIHAVNKKQNLFHRIFGIAVLTVDSGSTNTSHQAEITVIEKNSTVDFLMAELNSAKECGRKETVEKPKEELLLSENDSLYSFTSAKKMLYTLINIASTVFFTAIFAALTILVLSVCKLMSKQDFLGTWGQYFMYAALITVGAMLLFSIFSFIGCMINSFVRYYKFSISKVNGNIQISYGLLEKHTNTFNYSRIKAVKISQGLVQRALGFATIKLEVIGYTEQTGSENSDIGVLVPFCKYGEVAEILNRILPDYVPDNKKTNSPSFFPFVSWFLLLFGAVSGLTLFLTSVVMLILRASEAAILLTLLSLLGAAALILIIKLVSAILAYKTNGISFSDGKITAYSGGFLKTASVFYKRNLIAAENVTTPLRKKAGIRSLVIHLKTNSTSNEIKVHIQKDNISDELEKLLVL